MDPLSVTASVVGLLGAARQIASILYKVQSGLKDAPRSMHQLLSQLNELRYTFDAVNYLLIGIDSAPRRRISMIQVDQLVATLSDAVLTFSELEALVHPLATVSLNPSLVERMKWVWKEDTIGNIMLRLDRHKASLTLMLTIVHCTSDLQAQQSLRLLENLVQQLLESNHDISRRLQGFDTFDSESVLTTCFRNGSNSEVTENGEIEVIPQVSHEESKYFEYHASIESIRRTAVSYEIDLKTSRVYRRTQPYKEDVSFTSSAVRTHAWSVFSGLSLSQVSSISAIALPVYSEELFHPELFKVSSESPLSRHPAFWNFSYPEYAEPKAPLSKHRSHKDEGPLENTPEEESSPKQSALNIDAPLDDSPQELSLLNDWVFEDQASTEEGGVYQFPWTKDRRKGCLAPDQALTDSTSKSGFRRHKLVALADGRNFKIHLKAEHV